MKSLSSLVCVLVIAILSLTGCSSRIDAGHVGIRVNLYGDNKGVDDITAVTGRVWYNPFTTEVHKFPTFVQTKDYDPFIVNAKDASQFEVDPKLNYYVQADKVPSIFRKYRKSLGEIEDGYLKTAVFDAYRIVANKFTSDSLMSNRSLFEQMVQQELSENLNKEGFTFQQITSAITPPESLRAAIDAKNRAIQDALQAENKVKQAEAEAKIKVAKAEGDAREMEIRAKAESDYNKQVSQSLTPVLVQSKMIEKWDGKLPVYGTLPQLFKDVTK